MQRVDVGDAPYSDRYISSVKTGVHNEYIARSFGCPRCPRKTSSYVSHDVLGWRTNLCANKRDMHTDRWHTTIDLCTYILQPDGTYYPALHTTHTMTKQGSSIIVGGW